MNKKEGYIIGIMAVKGGTAKTVTTVSLAAALNGMGKNVLVIDADGQGSLTDYLNISNPNIVDVLDGKNIYDSIHKLKEGFSGIGTDNRLYGTEIKNGAFSKIIKPLKFEYDFIIIDFPPAISNNHIEFVSVLDYAVLPLMANSEGMAAYNLIIDYFEDLKKAGCKVPDILGVLLTFYSDRIKLNRIVANTFNEDGILFNTKIPSCMAVQQASAIQQSIIKYKPKSSAAISYINLAYEIINKLK